MIGKIINIFFIGTVITISVSWLITKQRPSDLFIALLLINAVIMGLNELVRD